MKWRVRRGQGRSRARPEAPSGVYVPPKKDPPLAPMSEVVADALIIARHGVRMAVKNRLIVRALRDGEPYERAALEAFARKEYRKLARANRESALRTEGELAEQDARTEQRRYTGGKRVEASEDLRRKPSAQRAVAYALETTAVEPDQISQLIDEATKAAWSEVGGVITARLARGRIDPGTADYREHRDERLTALAADLEALRRSAAVAAVDAERVEDAPEGAEL